MAASDVIRGRQTATRTLTNKSGGTVNLGDAVRIYDGSNDNSFTTTTTAAYNSGPVGIVMETIANNAAGLVALSGYVPLVNSNSGSLTRGRFLFTHTVAGTVTASATRAAGAFGYVLETGTNPEAIIFGMPDPTAGAGPTVTENFITGDVTMTNANTFYDGPSLSLGAGTYLLMGRLLLKASSGGYFTLKLWDGTTAIAASGHYEATSNGSESTPIHGYVVLGGSATYKISAALNGTGGKIIATPDANATGLTNLASHLIALKIA